MNEREKNTKIYINLYKSILLKTTWEIPFMRMTEEIDGINVYVILQNIHENC